MNEHFLQSAAWASFQRALGREAVREDGEGWSYQGFVTRGRGGIRYLYCPYGPTLSTKGAMKKVVEDWKQRLDVDFVRCEPMGDVTAKELEALGLRRAGEVQPQHTLVVDLTQDEAALRQDLASGHRNAINGAGRRGLSFRVGEHTDLDYFLRFIHATAQRTGFRPHADEYFQTMLEALEPLGAAKLFVAEHEGWPVAAAIAFDHNGIRAYAHAAGDPEARKLQATTPLLWHMMMDAKAAGMTAFDLWGVAPGDAPSSHPWAGFTKFKRGFGGTEQTYAGTWELPLRRGKYGVYSLTKRLMARGRS